VSVRAKDTWHYCGDYEVRNFLRISVLSIVFKFIFYICRALQGSTCKTLLALSCDIVTRENGAYPQRLL